ncbi:MAG TPA: response regulator [Acidobacteriaceae bacterium]|jgi:CheY-like chemotaxis protein/HPt (histidine-containing phosphotransfer) domain-containing protein|nr:response regulator [Acidobacteriaceae bacterium]
MDSGPATAPRRVLAVDDDPISLAVTAVLLEAEGCLVLQAQSGEQALDLAKTNLFDCILADLRMPGLASTELALSLRQAAPQALLLAMSATPPPRLEGYDGVLRKPLSPDGLRAALAQWPAATANRRQPRPGKTLPEPIPSGPAHPDPDSAVVIDAAIFNRLRHAISPDGLTEIFTVFVNDTMDRLRLMRRAVADAEIVRRESHTVKGGASMLGALQVARAAAVLEAGIDNPDDRLRKLDEIEAHCRHAELILKQRLKT